jgi:hypothetical protein
MASNVEEGNGQPHTVPQAEIPLRTGRPELDIDTSAYAADSFTTYRPPDPDSAISIPSSNSDICDGLEGGSKQSIPSSAVSMISIGINNNVAYEHRPSFADSAVSTASPSDLNDAAATTDDANQFSNLSPMGSLASFDADLTIEEIDTLSEAAGYFEPKAASLAKREWLDSRAVVDGGADSLYPSSHKIPRGCRCSSIPGPNSKMLSKLSSSWTSESHYATYHGESSITRTL